MCERCSGEILVASKSLSWAVIYRRKGIERRLRVLMEGAREKNREFVGGIDCIQIRWWICSGILNWKC